MEQSNPADRIEINVDQPIMPAASDMKFEAALAELEQIIQSMDSGLLPLEESIAAYRRGSDLLKRCQQQLSDADREIQIIENGALRDFDAIGKETL